MATVSALAPIALMLICMVGLGWSAARSGVVGAAVAFAIAVLVFDYEPTPVGLAGPLLEAAFTALSILWIIFPALALHEFQTRSGSSGDIGTWLSSISRQPTIIVLILAWFFALLLEGVAGFGTPVALVAPLLVALGHSPQKALALALVGHAAGVSFGAVGTPMVPLLGLIVAEPQQLSLTIMLLHTAVGWTLTLALLRLAFEGAGWRQQLIALMAAFLFLVPALALAALAGPELPTLGGALIGGAFFIVWARWQNIRHAPKAAAPSLSVLSAIFPYLLVLGLVMGTRIIPETSALLQSVRLQWSLDDRFSSMIQPLYHPGTMLLIALCGTFVIRRQSREFIRPSLAAAAGRLPLVGLALLSVLLLSRIMVHSGMIAGLAGAAATGLGAWWPVAVPLVGALGSFITGSATASNILFAAFQIVAADVVGLAPVLALAGQAFGAAIGNIIAPHNIVAGATTVGLIGREGAVLRTTLPICIAYATVGGLLLLMLAGM